MSSPLAAPVSHLNSDDCPCHLSRCDPVPDTIKTLIQPKSRKQECQHPQEVDRLPWATKFTLTSVRVWKDANEKVSYKTRCCKFKRLCKAPLVAGNQGVSERTPGKTRRQCTLEVQSPLDEHGLSGQLPRLGPLVVPPPSDEFRRQLLGPIEGLRGTISMFNTTQTKHQHPIKHKDVGE
ncbi:hypothetical protein AAG906_003342 [Vitis piasezkii]